jgi:serine/threonine protein kinase
MAPEFEDGFHEDVLPNSDIYSMGKILYWMVSNGDKFSREKHKEERYDLRQKIKETWIHHIYEILDSSICNKSSERYQSAEVLRAAVDQCIETIRYHGRAVSARDQRCIFCAIGKYKIVANGALVLTNTDAQRMHWNNVSNYLYPPRSSATSILECDNCGNIQFFNLSNQPVIDKWKMLK